MRKLMIFIGVMVAITPAFAQNGPKTPSTFKTFGFSGLGLFDIQSYLYTKQRNFQVVREYEVHYSAYSMTWGKRWNLLESGDHFSVSLETSPMLGLSFGSISNMSFMAINVPIMLGINSGAAATFRSVNLGGISYSAGVDIAILPIFGDGSFDPQGPTPMFCNSLKFRRWTYKGTEEGRGRELEFFAALGAQNLSQRRSTSAVTFLEYRPFHFALIFRKMLNY